MKNDKERNVLLRSDGLTIASPSARYYRDVFDLSLRGSDEETETDQMIFRWIGCMCEFGPVRGRAEK